MFRFSVKPMLVALTVGLTACGSGSDSSNSTATSGGVISSGTITGFGSVFVNGVEFETDSATFDIDGVAGTQADLAIGMRVDIQGTINDDGVTGNATSVDFNVEIQGPVAGLAGDAVTKTFTVFGTDVIIDASTTRFDDDSGAFSFTTIADKNNVEISGFIDANNVLHATRVGLEDLIFDANSTVEVKGLITGLVNTTFTLGNLTVDASSAQLEDLNSLVDGVNVEAKGTYDEASNTLTATKVEGRDDGLEDSDNEIEFEGFVTRYISDSDFDVDGRKVDASNAEKEPASLQITEGIQIEVEGKVTGGILIASEVKTRGGDDKVGALVKSTNIDPVTKMGTFELEPVTGAQTITVRVTSTTEVEDEDSKFSTTDIMVGNYISVEGYTNNAGELEAKNVKRKDATNEDVFVKGVVSAVDSLGGMNVTVLGVEFSYDGSTSLTPPALFSDPAVIAGTATIKVKDTIDGNGPGVADSIELDD